MTNRLAQQSSPYLRQHMHNPVDWYPWGDEAFVAARESDRPLLVSLGYSTCHWCHVMAHESFEDPATAALLNEHFIAIKVDREERPDVDAVYMQAVQVLGQQGGWPLNVFVTPDGLPFYGGTYWPREPRYGMPSFRQVLSTLADAWRTDRDTIRAGGRQIADHLTAAADADLPTDALASAVTDRALKAVGGTFDPVHGGFGSAPKFPQSPTHEWLLRHYARTGNADALAITRKTLSEMASGGIHDHLGGGFARYSTDAEWHVPHFEKMLYDNAMLLPLYATLANLDDDDRFASVAAGTVRWLEREMLLPNGGFAAALDADSEGHEGTYYVWTAADIDTLLPPEDADLVKLHYGIADPGSFEGKNVLRVVRDADQLAETLNQPVSDIRARLDAIRQSLLTAREQREHPHRDDKVIGAWNGLAIHGLVTAGQLLHRADWIELATQVASAVRRHLTLPDGAVARSFTDARISGPGMLEDYASLARAFLSIYAATADEEWSHLALTITRRAQETFAHPSGIGWFDAPAENAELFLRPREFTDAATPSANALMAEVVAMLGVMTQENALSDRAADLVGSLVPLMERHPAYVGASLAVAERLLTPSREIVFAGNPASPSLRSLREGADVNFDPFRITGFSPGDVQTFPMLADRPAVDGGAAYVCGSGACQLPVSAPTDLVVLLQ